MLASDSHDVDMIVRERFVAPLRSGGLRVTGIFGEHGVPAGGIGACTTVDDVIDRDYDYALVTTKSFDTDSALGELARLRRQRFIVVSLQNGCGNFEKVVERFGAERALGGRVITGFAIESPGHVRITVTADDIHIGGPVEGIIPDSAHRIAGAIDHSGLPCKSTSHIRRDLFAKLLYNCALNPLGAALGVHYGALGDDPGARSIMDAVIGEVFAVIGAMGGETHWKTADEYRAFFYDKQIPATYDHRSSMLQDLERGSRTEVDALTGYVGAKGREYGVPTPVCDTLTEIVRFREKKNSGQQNMFRFSTDKSNFEIIKTDHKFLLLLRLSRLLNSIRFAAGAVNLGSPKTPSYDRQLISSFLFIGAILFECFKSSKSNSCIYDDLKKEFDSLSSFKNGFLRLKNDPKRKWLHEKVLPLIRDKIIFHYDDYVMESSIKNNHTHSYDADEIVFAQSHTEQDGDWHYKLADDLVFKYMVIKVEDDSTSVTAIQENIKLIGILSSQLIDAGDMLIKDVLTNQFGWYIKKIQG